MTPDPVIDEIRRVRHEMSAEIGHDPKRLLAYYAEIQQRFRNQLVNHGDRALEQVTRNSTSDTGNGA